MSNGKNGNECVVALGAASRFHFVTYVILYDITRAPSLRHNHLHQTHQVHAGFYAEMYVVLGVIVLCKNGYKVLLLTSGSLCRYHRMVGISIVAITLAGDRGGQGG